MGSSRSRSWEWPCAPWATCQTRWSWKSSFRDWTWTVRQTHSWDFMWQSTEALLYIVPQNWTLLGSKTSVNKHQLPLFFFPQATARWTLRSSSLFWAQSWQQLRCQISSTAPTLTLSFGRCSLFSNFLLISKRTDSRVAAVANLQAQKHLDPATEYDFKGKPVLIATSTGFVNGMIFNHGEVWIPLRTVSLIKTLSWYLRLFVCGNSLIT